MEEEIGFIQNRLYERMKTKLQQVIIQLRRIRQESVRKKFTKSSVHSATISSMKSMDTKGKKFKNK